MKAKTQTGHYYTTLVEIDGDGGSRKTLLYNREDACLGRKSPIEVTRATLKGISFKIWMSKVMLGCPDSNVVLNWKDDKTLEGTRLKTQSLTMTRD